MQPVWKEANILDKSEEVGEVFGNECEAVSTYAEVSSMIDKLNHSLLPKRNHYMGGIINLENKFSQLQVNKIKCQKQSKIINFF